MLIFKHARVGGEVTMHQDSTFIFSQPETCIGFWFALQDATLENGAMYALPGWHKGPLERRFFRTGDGAGTDLEDLSAVDWPLGAAVAQVVVLCGERGRMCVAAWAGCLLAAGGGG